MSMISLDVDSREGVGKGVSRKLRKKGLIPGVFYNNKGTNVKLCVNAKLLIKAVSGEAGLNTLIELNVKEDSKFGKKPVLVKDLQFDPVTRDSLHVDFVEVDLTQASHGQSTASFCWKGGRGYSRWCPSAYCSRG